ncbi:MAG: lysophospholipid acyltransferase family protein [Candidatus Eisenbacteria bacterium]|nr:lysophospholipid acyltransferase family protein [Candidatus Eisenbacteria bacterium]
MARPLDMPWMSDIGPEVPWIGRAAAGTLRLLGSTWRIRTVGATHDRAAHAGGSRVIYALWHGRILPLIFAHRGQGVGTLVSRHRDGEFLAVALEMLGYTVRRGSSKRGGAEALLAMRELAGERDVAITPDGPRGPAGAIYPGVLMLARRTGLPIVPVSCVASSAWHFGTWDRFMVPRPGALVEIRFGEPLRVTADLDAGGMEPWGRRLASALDELGRPGSRAALELSAAGAAQEVP